MASPQFPVEIKKLTDEEDKLIKKYYKAIVEEKPFLRFGPSGKYLLTGYEEFAAEFYNLKVRPDDIFVITFPRSGTTWTQELVWLVMNNLDFETAQSIAVNTRYSYLEYPTNKMWLGKSATFTSDIRNFSELISPRFAKTHVPLSLLPKTLLDTAKVIIYVARDPRDVAVSYYFIHKLFKNIDDSVTFKEFWDLFQKGLIKNTPIFPHIKEAWDKRNHPNMLFLFYEEMQNDLLGVIDRVCEFLGKEYTDEQKQNLAEYVKFGNMKKKKHVMDRKDDEELAFFRKGKSGNWVQYFDEEMMKKAEEFMEKNLKETDMRFPDII